MPAIAFVILAAFCGWMLFVGVGNIRGAWEGNILYGGTLSEAILGFFGGRVYQGCFGLILIIGSIAGIVWIITEAF